MNTHKVTTNTLDETVKLASKLADYLHAGDVITLEGELGVGKTAFTKGIAKGLHVAETVTSPTFTIIKEYEGALPLYHMDVYRLEHSEEDIGFDEYFNGNGVSVVEWAKFVEPFLPDEKLEITLEYIDEQTRLITFKAEGAHYEKLLKGLFN